MAKNVFGIVCEFINTEKVERRLSFKNETKKPLSLQKPSYFRF